MRATMDQITLTQIYEKPLKANDPRDQPKVENERPFRRSPKFVTPAPPRPASETMLGPSDQRRMFEPLAQYTPEDLGSSQTLPYVKKSVPSNQPLMMADSTNTGNAFNQQSGQKFQREYENQNRQKGDRDSFDDEEDDDDCDENVDLSQEEIEEFTQSWSLLGDDVTDDGECIDFSQTQADDEVDLERKKKRRRLDEKVTWSQPLSCQKTDIWVGKQHWFQVNEKYYLEPRVNTLDGYEKVYTIKGFREGTNSRKVAVCHVALLAKKSHLGEHKEFDEEAFEKKFGTKYISFRKSQEIPLRDLVGKKVKEEENVVNSMLFYDESSTKIRGAGWTASFTSAGPHCHVRTSKKPRVMDLFAGTGAVGKCFEMEDFSVLVAVDKDPLAYATSRLNKSKNTMVVQQDAPDFLARLKQGQYGARFLGSIHCHVSSPCQGFSRASTTGKFEKKEQFNRLCTTFPRAMIDNNMMTGTFENVTGMLDERWRHHLRNMIYEFVMNDYQVRVAILDSSEYGDPQERKRVIFFVAQNGVRLPNVPEPTHGPGRLPIKTARDAIRDLELVEPHTEEGIHILPNGMVVNDHYLKEDKKNDKTKTNKIEDKSFVLVADEPANTLLCGHAIKHYNCKRMCTNLELARIQSFPDGYEFAGTPSQIRKQIGNAVPMGLGAAIARAVKAVYRKSSRHRRQNEET